MLERLNQALDHLEACLDRDVDVAEVARIAAVSEYHFRRLFSALAGMPLPVYVRRRRMTLAAAEVLAGELTLLDVAVRYGYGSGEAFARAFRALHGVGPGEARRTKPALVSQPRLSFRLTVEGNSSMRYRVVERPDFSVVGPKARVPLVYQGPNQSIIDFVRSVPPETLSALKQLSKDSGEAPEGIVAVCDDLDPGRAEGSELDYYHGVVAGPDAPAPAGTTALPVPAGTWAVFTTSGPAPEAIQALWATVYAEWFPANPYRTRPGPEILRTQMSADGTTADAELWLPVEREPS